MISPYEQRIRLALRTVAHAASDDVAERIEEHIRQRRTNERELLRLADDVEHDCSDVESSEEIRRIANARRH